MKLLCAMHKTIKTKFFISYSADSSLHTRWALDLYLKLLRFGVGVIIEFPDINQSATETSSIEQNIENSDKVFILCTPEYKRRAEDQNFLVKTHIGIIASELCSKDVISNKFIPILASGTWQTSLPDYLQNIQGVDLSDESTFSIVLKEFMLRVFDLSELEETTDQGEQSYTFSLVGAEYPGGNAAFMNDISSNTKYPLWEKWRHIGGTVIVRFSVEIDGSVGMVEIVQGVEGTPNFSKAAIKAVKKLKRFSPAMQNGKPVRYSFKVPVTFGFK
jgi:TonB family protein